MNKPSVIVHVSIPNFYEFEGWIFEYSRTKPFAPYPCKKDLQSRARVGKKFYAMFSRFLKLPEREQEQCRIEA